MRGLGFAAAALMAPPLAFPSAKALVPLLAITVLFELFVWLRAGKPFPRPPIIWAWPLLALIAWGASSALWSIDPNRSLTVALSFSGITLLGLISIPMAQDLNAASRQRLGRALIGGLVLAALLFITEGIGNAGLHFAIRDAVDGMLGRLTQARADIDYRFVLNNGVTVAVLLCWPAAIALWRRHGWPGAIPVIAFAMLMALASDSTAAALAAAAGVVALLATTLAPRIATGLVALGLAAAILGTPTAVNLLPRPDRLVEHAPFLSNSAYHRLFIWDFAGARIGERPLLGWGLDASRSIPGGAIEILAIKPLPTGHVIETQGELLPLHPHNAPVQLWLELGFVGALLAALFAVRTVRAIGDIASAGIIRATGLAQISGAFAIGASGYGLWQSWWLAALWLATTFYVALAEEDSES